MTLRGRGEALLDALALCWFAFQATWFALQIHPFAPPDEVTHVGRVLAFAGSWWLPQDGPETWALGPLGTIPPLYYWAMGRAVWLLGSSDLVVLRLCNVALGVATVAVGIAWARSSIQTPLARGLFVVLLANVSMFAFLSGSVSYDNATNLLAAASIYAWLRYFRTPTRASLLRFVVCLELGALTKVSFLPLAAILVVLLCVREWRDGRRGPGDLATRPTAAVVIAGIFAVALLGANATLYGGNLLRFGALRPAADRVLGLPAALENRIFARDYAVRGFRRGDLSFDEAVEVARRIGHPGDRANALVLLRRERDRAHTPGTAPSAFRYPIVWSWQMLRSSVGVSGHLVLNKGAVALLVCAAIAAVAVVGWARSPCTRGDAGSWGLAITASYLFVLMALVGWPAYRESGAAVAAHGRYAFVVLVPALGWLATSLLDAFPERTRRAVAVVTGVAFVAQGFPWFVARAAPVWFASGG